LQFFPEDMRDEASIVTGVALVLIALLAFAKWLRLIEWRTLKPATGNLPPPVKTPSPAPVTGPLSREQVLGNVAAGVIDRATAEWLFSQLPKPDQALPAEAMKEARDAFIETVETMGAAPKPGELDALRRIADGDTKGALAILDNSVGPDQPDQLRTLAAIAAPADTKLAVETFSRFVSATVSRPMSAKTDAALLYASPAVPGVEIGLVPGNIADVRGVDAWVNSENDWLSMARTVDRSISAHIRYLSSRRNAEGVPLNDPMQQALRPNAYGRIKPMKLGAIRITGSGALRQSHGVKRVLHVVSVKAKPLGGAALKEEPGRYVSDVMRAAEQHNRSFFRLFDGARLHSMIVPMFGTGMAGEDPDAMADMLVDGLLRGAVAISRPGRAPALRRVQIVAYSTQQYLPMRRAFEKRIATGDLVRTQAGAAAG
jgi:O-acetyl-ADP-ribose deacetylase (regulator of RNase III)